MKGKAVTIFLGEIKGKPSIVFEQKQDDNTLFWKNPFSQRTFNTDCIVYSRKWSGAYNQNRMMLMITSFYCFFLYILPMSWVCVHYAIIQLVYD